MPTRIRRSAQIVLALTALTPAGFAGQLEQQNRALQIATRFIADNCQRPLARGTETTVTMRGEIDIRLQGLAKAIAGAGGGGGGEFKKVTWDGAALDQFAQALESGNQCAVEMLRLLIGIGLVPRTPDALAALNSPAPPEKDAPAERRASEKPASPAEDVRRDEFSVSEDWWTGEASGEFGRVTRTVLGGTYYWTLWFHQTVSSFPVTAPYPSAIEFTVAVDVEFPPARRSLSRAGERQYHPARDFAAGLVFGKSGDSEYLFRIGKHEDGTAKYGLHRYDDGKGFSAVLDWNRAKIDLRRANRLQVAVAGGLARMSINDGFVDEIRLGAFNGGRVGLDASGTLDQHLTVSFDNFEFRQTRER
jgi:hypothetical protein